MKRILVLTLLWTIAGCTLPAKHGQTDRTFKRKPASIAKRKPASATRITPSIRRVRPLSRGLVVKLKGQFDLDKFAAIEGFKRRHSKRNSLFFNSDESSGELRNRVHGELKALGVTMLWLESHMSVKGAYQKDSVLEFACRVQIAHTLGQFILYGSINALDCNCLRDVRPLYRKNAWGIRYKSKPSEERLLEVRTTLDAIEYTMGHISMRKNRKVCCGHDKKPGSPLESLALFKWERIEVVKNKRSVSEHRKLLLNDLNRENLREFLLESGVYRDLLESIGISVP